MIKVIAFLFASLAVSANCTNLRAQGNHDDGRKLQLASNVLNDLITQFTPQISALLQAELKTYDPIKFTNETTVDLGNSTFDGACPESSAKLTYGVGSIAGLSNLKVNEVKLVEGSEKITVSFLALDGATWAGDWAMSFTLPNVTAQTYVKIQANLCGFPLDQTISGSTSFSNVDIDATASIAGKTANVLQFRQTSQITEVVVDSMELAIGSVTMDLGVQGSVVQNLNVAQSLEEQILTKFTTDVEPFLTNVLNSYFETNVPIDLMPTAVSKNGGN